ncbi:MAG: DUF4261 domain-containing protein [Bacteroidota bacterium]
MGILNLFKKKTTNYNPQPLLSMVMFDNNETFNLESVVEYLTDTWGQEIEEITGDDEASSFVINGNVIGIGTIPVQIPWEDITGTADYAYNWPTVLEDLKQHNSHLIVSMLGHKTSTALERYQLLTMVLTAILDTSNAVGVYQGSQSLLISRKQYLKSAEALKQNEIPVDLWVYIGLRPHLGKNNAYTYGLTWFSKLEMEVVDSNSSLEVLYNQLFDICAYIIGNDVTLKDGETIGNSIEEKIQITQSKGVFVAGQTLKLNC